MDWLEIIYDREDIDYTVEIHFDKQIDYKGYKCWSVYRITFDYIKDMIEFVKQIDNYNEIDICYCIENYCYEGDSDKYYFNCDSIDKYEEELDKQFAENDEEEEE